ncbi:MAG TPA: selenocysteine-specific translation elongation factor [Candidatus Brocadiia bacterium]|nr:selenocysteine-specific translation elongation factor [Candidatus Brocadiia bacterium]
MNIARHVVFGTAGHVDHGKSTLVTVLTGTDPDRLAEEKAREMTIDIGFAFLPLKGLENEAAIVDVPGHEMFVRNMVAGASGIDAAIFVVAADEGVMPQTIEHLDVLKYLGVPTGVIALTKSDRADAQRLARSRDEITKLVKGTFLEKASIVSVSAVTGSGLEELRAELSRLSDAIRARPTDGIFRLNIDRVFTLKGVGTVVTGTVRSGRLSVGETVACLPRKSLFRVRGLHFNNAPVTTIMAGQRAALNLADAAKDDMQRGDALATPGALEPSLMIDVRLTLSGKCRQPMKQRTRVRIHHGTQEVMARVVFLEADTLSPGESGLAQLRLEAPIVPSAGDLFVVRSYSPMFVIGGGNIVDPHPPKRRKASGGEDVAERESLPIEELLIEALDRAGARGMNLADIRIVCALPEEQLQEIMRELSDSARIQSGRRDLWFSTGAVSAMAEAALSSLASFHRKEPARAWIALNNVISAVAPLPEHRECQRLAIESLKEKAAIELRADKLRLANHKPAWSGRDATIRSAILEEFKRCGLGAPSPSATAEKLGCAEKDCRRVMDAMLDSEELVALDRDIFVLPDVLARSKMLVVEHLEKNGRMTVGQCRDMLGASRKYLLPLLEGLDREGVTAREGDFRTLRRKKSAE